MVDTYYTPLGMEHALQEPNEPAEIVVFDRAVRGEHVHTWSKDTGLMCVRELESMTDDDGRTYQVPVPVKIPRGETCPLGDKERFK